MIQGNRQRAKLSNLYGSTILTYISFGLAALRNLLLANLLSPADFAANALSSQIIAVGLFLDFGQFFIIRMRPIAHGKHQLHLLAHSGIRLAMSRYLVAAAGLFILYGLVAENRWWFAIALIAAAVVLPLQGLATIYSTNLSALGMQNYSATGMLAGAAANFIATFALLPACNHWVIVLGPALGYLIAICIFLFAPKKPRMSSSADSIPLPARARATLISSQFLALLLVSCDFFAATTSLALSDLSGLALASNLVTFISILPIAFSNFVSPHFVQGNSSARQTAETSILDGGRIFLTSSLGLLIGAATAGFEILVSVFFERYTQILLSIPIFVLSFYIYGCTFYTSTYLAVRNLQKEVVKAQIYSLGMFALFFGCVIALDFFSLTTLAFISLCKMAVYSILLNRTVRKSTESSSPDLSPYPLVGQFTYGGVILLVGYSYQTTNPWLILIATLAYVSLIPNALQKVTRLKLVLQGQSQ